MYRSYSIIYICRTVQVAPVTFVLKKCSQYISFRIPCHTYKFQISAIKTKCVQFYFFPVYFFFQNYISKKSNTSLLSFWCAVPLRFGMVVKQSNYFLLVKLILKKRLMLNYNHTKYNEDLKVNCLNLTFSTEENITTN